MSKVTEAIRSHHRQLIDKLSQQVSALTERQPWINPQDLVTFLKDDLLPHAQGEEKHLYPVMDDLIKDHGQPTATMSVDHEFVQSYIRQIEETVDHLRSASDEQRTLLEEKLRRLALQLEALLTVHLEKEERVYLPLFECYMPDQEQQLILDGMHEAYGSEDQQERKSA